MIYPYTIVKSKDIGFMYKFLKENGFKFNSYINVNYYKSFDCVYCVINDTGVFGKFCFYEGKHQLDKNRIRKFIPNNQEFICEVYKLVGYNEL